MPYILGFARCRCHTEIPVQPYNTEADRTRWVVTGGGLPYVACDVCKRYFLPSALVPRVSPYGLSPFDEGAPQHTFRVTRKCEEDQGCPDIEAITVQGTQLTFDAALREVEGFAVTAMRCSNGHPQGSSSRWR